jgi:RNA-binding protein YhbY
MTVGKKKHVKRAFAQRKPKACIGKSGTSQELPREIEKQMKKEQMVKVRILKNASANDETAS